MARDERTSSTRPTVTAPAQRAAHPRRAPLRHIDLSNVSVEQLEEARSIVDVVTVQNRFNLTDRRCADALEVCGRDGPGFFPWFGYGSRDSVTVDRTEVEPV